MQLTAIKRWNIAMNFLSCNEILTSVTIWNFCCNECSNVYSHTPNYQLIPQHMFQSQSGHLRREETKIVREEDKILMIEIRVEVVINDLVYGYKLTWILQNFSAGLTFCVIDFSSSYWLSRKLGNVFHSLKHFPIYNWCSLLISHKSMNRLPHLIDLIRNVGTFTRSYSNVDPNL